MNEKEQKEFVSKHYLDYPIKRLATFIGRSQTFVRNELKRQNLVIPRELIEKRKRESYYSNGHNPFNKGKKQTEYMSKESIERTAKTRFKKGREPHNTKFDFCISKRMDTSNRYYYYIRIDKSNWVLLHRYIWEQVNGPIPDGFNVQFKDGNSIKCNIENLYLVNRKNQVFVNKNGGNKLPFEQRKSLELINRINLKVKEYEKTT